MGSLMFPMMVNFFRDDLKEETIGGVDYKHHCWFHIDNKLMIYPMGGKSFPGLHEHTQNIQFTMDTETDDPLIFLDINICRRPDEYWGHTSSKILTHSNLYFNATLHHHLADK
jgi:hypothetical protein